MKSPAARTILLQIVLLGVTSALLASSPRSVSMVKALQDARLALESSVPALAADSLARAHALSPWRSDLLLMAGRSALDADEPTMTIQYLEQASSSAALPPDSLMMLGEAYLAVEDPQAAIQVWQQIPESAGLTDEILFRRLEIYQAQHDYTQAAEVLTAIIHRHPDDPRYYYQLGLLLAAIEPEASLAYLSQAAQADASLASRSNELIRQINTARLYEEPAYMSLSVGRWMAAVGEWRLAKLAFEQAVLKRPDYAEAWALLGEALQHVDDPDSTSLEQPGFKEIQTALDINPDSFLSNLVMSLYWHRQGAVERTLEYLEKSAALQPDDPMIMAELGRINAIHGDIPTAQAYYEQAVVLAPSDPSTWLMLAEFSLQYQVQVRQVALPAARSTVLLAPQDPLSFDLLGKTMLALGDLVSAERFLRHAIMLDANCAAAHLHLGIVFLTRGDQQLAQQEFEMAEHIAPGTQIADHVDRLNSYLFP